MPSETKELLKRSKEIQEKLERLARESKDLQNKIEKLRESDETDRRNKILRKR